MGKGEPDKDRETACHQFSKGAVHQTIYFPEVKAFHVALPPLDEQKRIVARVDQLMAFMDELEAKQNRKREVGARFTKASLEALTTARAGACARTHAFGARTTSAVVR